MKRIISEWCALSLKKSAIVPLARQIYDQIRDLILADAIDRSALLPSTRQLAAQLSVSRNTIINAYEQLQAEGYIESVAASGYRISQDLDTATFAKHSKGKKIQFLPTSKREKLLFDTQSSSLLRFTKPQPFRIGTPAFCEFPFALWRSLIDRQLKNIRPEQVMYSNTGGYPPLRQAIAHYIRGTRGVTCEAEQIVIFSGAQQAISVLSKVIADEGDTVWIEDPGYLAARKAFQDASLTLIPVPVDDEGITLPKKAKPRIIYTTPSNQCPLGQTLSAARRIELLEFARANRCWILEDDYNSEIRYAGQPILSLQGMSEHSNVLYIGTFSKIMFPSLRIGFAVLPQDLIAKAVFMRSLDGVHSCTVEHAALAEFISGGHLARHVRKMRRLYSARKKVLEDTLSNLLPAHFSVVKSSAGMHSVLTAPHTVDDVHIAQIAAQQGIEVTALSRYYLQTNTVTKGWLLGFSGFSETKLIDAAKRFCKLLSHSF